MFTEERVAPVHPLRLRREAILAMQRERKWLPAAGGTWVAIYKAGLLADIGRECMRCRRTDRSHSVTISLAGRAVLLSDTGIASRHADGLEIRYSNRLGQPFASCRPVYVDEIHDLLISASLRWPQQADELARYISGVLGPIAAMRFAAATGGREKG